MGFRIEVQETGEVFDAGREEAILDAATRQGIGLRHECTFGTCGTCRVRLVEGTVRYDEPQLALSAAEVEQGFALMCQAHALSPLVISTTRVLPSVAAPARHTAIVKALSPLTPDVLHLRLELPSDVEPAWRPGQYMNVDLADGTHRSFSMASCPASGAVDFHVRRIAGGRFTDGQLAAIQPGESLEIEFPLGAVGVHKADYRPLLMVATGTGIAPIKSMLESLLDDDECPPVWLYWGMRTETDLYLDEVFRSWQGRLYEFQYVPVLSRAGAFWRGRRGHVQQAVTSDLPDLSEHGIYLCGSPVMTDEAKNDFVAHGALLDHLHVDAFTFQQEF
ncbi:MAG: 2Fe-2S iron-sulfur cluster-binding protein [Pseudomonadota bacterium]|nr:2Fe-2S iron-sulfur cluster-binding protein [Pseudomonadota bacterium]